MRNTNKLSLAIARAKAYNEKGLAVSISYLPTHSRSKNAVAKNINEYRLIIDAILAEKIDADITVKPQQFGTSMGKDIAIAALQAVIALAHKHHTRVWLDQELEHDIDIMHEAALIAGPQKVGICIQAFRQRSQFDIPKFNNFPIRLVKGFYNDFDISPWSKVTENYEHLMHMLVKNTSTPCFATHDEKLITRAKTLLDQNGKRGEIQFFAGVRDDLAVALAREGYNVRIYLPYGRVYAFLWFGLPIFDRVRALKRLLGYNVIT